MSNAADNQVPSRGVGTLIDLARPYLGRMVGLASVSMLGALIEAAFLVLLLSAVLAFANGQPLVGPVGGIHLPMGQAIGLAAIAISVRLLLALVGVLISSHLTARVTTDYRHELAVAYLESSWALQHGEPSGRFQELLVSFVYRATQAISALTQGITAVVSLFAFIGTGALVDPIATVAMLVVLLLLGLLLAPLRQLVRRRASFLAEANLTFSSTASELGALGQEMQTFGVQGAIAERIDHLTHVTSDQQRRLQTLSGALSPLYTAFAYSAVLVGMAILGSGGSGNLTGIGTVMLLLLRSLSYGQQLMTMSGTLASTTPFLERLDRDVTRYRTNRRPQGSTVPGQVAPLAFQRIGYRYPHAARPALADLQFSVARGEMLGIIGPSGSGKSTLAQVLLGLRSPTAGNLEVDGVPINEVDRHWWAERVAFVAQDALLMTGTVADNIRFFRSGITEADLRVSARRANVLSTIEHLPDGFNTHLGERGSQLSGGQRQRLSIARALAGDPELLILDEPTSALDSESEQLIRDTLAALHGTMTIIIVAHRLSTLDLCDRIAVIEKGRLSAIDTPARLRVHNDFYRRALEISGVDVEDTPDRPGA